MKGLIYYIGDSNIHGKGVIAFQNLRKNAVVGLGIGFEYDLFPYVTPEFGAYLNHSYNPTAYLWYFDDEKICKNRRNKNKLQKKSKNYFRQRSDSGWYVKTLNSLKAGEEITVNYNDTPWYIEGPKPHYV